MMTNFFIRHFIIYFFVLILPLYGFSWKANGKSPFTNVDEITCSDVVVKVFTECSSGNKAISLSECTKQYFVFSDKKTGESNKVECSGRTIAHYGPNGESLGNYLYALASSWACVQGKDRRYLLVMYTTGGTCNGCEWAEIYSLDGHRLANDRVLLQGKEVGYSPVEKFKRTYKRLGLPEPWPRGAFEDIRLFNADRQ